jgi:hypothetical protein
VRPVSAEERAEHVKKWAAKCVADAMIAGISFEEIHNAAVGNVQDYIAKAAECVAAGPTASMPPDARPNPRGGPGE